MPDATSTESKLDCTISAKVIRADGTEEDLGVISTTVVGPDDEDEEEVTDDGCADDDG